MAVLLWADASAALQGATVTLFAGDEHREVAEALGCRVVGFSSHYSALKHDGAVDSPELLAALQATHRSPDAWAAVRQIPKRQEDGGRPPTFAGVLDAVLAEAAVRPIDAVVAAGVGCAALAAALGPTTLPVWVTLWPKSRTARWPTQWRADIPPAEYAASHDRDVLEWLGEYKVQLLELAARGMPPTPAPTAGTVRNMVEGRDPRVLAIGAYSRELYGATGFPPDLGPEARAMHAGFFFLPHCAPGADGIAGETAAVCDFAAAGDSPPVYFGWGSMTPERPDALLRTVLTAARALGVRAVVLRGRAGLGPELLGDEPGDEGLCDFAAASCCFPRSVHHDVLLPRCKCAVIHGGAGTTAATLRSGIPTIVSPVYWDQPWFGDRIAELGLGLRIPAPAELKPAALEAALREVLGSPEMHAAAASVGARVRAERGVEAAADRLLAALRV